MFKVYKASAGSGKTTNLVAEYLSLCLLKPDKFRHILAITFTNNATAEMKDRIVKTLQTFAFTSPSDMKGSDKAIYDMLMENERFRALPNHEFQEKSQLLLKKILYDYPNFTISTIDSFFQRVIRSFAYEFGISMNYNVQIDLSDCYAQTVDMLLNKLSKQDPDLSNRIMFLVDKQMNESGKWQLEKSLKSSLHTVYDERFFEPAKILSQWHEEKVVVNGKESNKLVESVLKLHQKQGIQHNKLCAAVDDFCSLFWTLGNDEKAFVGMSKGIYAWCKALPLDRMKAPSEAIINVLEKDSVLKKPTPESVALQPRLREKVQQIVDLQLSLADLSAVVKNTTSFLLLFDLKEIMDDIKMRDNLFFLSETNSRIFDEIKDDDAPYVFEKIGNKYSYFFVDEFQDTSKMQWEDMKPLILNALSGINQFGDPGEAILFGDVKQSIYRFRNGDSKLLNSLSNYEELSANFPSVSMKKDDFVLQPLSKNYRSSKAVVSFNNEFFNFLKQEPFAGNQLLVDYYDDVEQQIAAEREGFVYVRFKQPEGEDDEYLNVESLKAIRDALSRGYDYKDMAVLSKANGTCAAIAQYLAKHQISVISSDSLRLDSSPQVTLLVNTLRFLLNPSDTLSQLAVAEYFCKNNLSEVISMLKQPDGFMRFVQTLGNRVDLDKLLHYEHLIVFPVFTVVKELLLAYKLSVADAYIITFMDAVYENFNSQFSDLTQLLTWWDEKGCRLSINSSKGTNAVTVTTIHKSKGLQYPIVIYPMKSYRNANGSDTVWVQNANEELELPYLLLPTNEKALKSSSFKSECDKEKSMTEIDNVNAIYVAHTRAGDGLYIITNEFAKGNYARYLTDFIVKKLNDATPQKEYWFGDKNYVKQNTAREEVPNPSVQQLFSSDFTLLSDQLVCGKFSSSQQELGIFIHDYLSGLKNFPQTEDQLSELMSEIDDSEERQILNSVLRKIMTDDSLKPYFEPGAKVLNETTILTANGHLRRPDRIVFLDDEVMVIDYKTGKENEAYQQQLDEYCGLLEQMGYQNVHSRLLYLF